MTDKSEKEVMCPFQPSWLLYSIVHTCGHGVRVRLQSNNSHQKCPRMPGCVPILWG